MTVNSGSTTRVGGGVGRRGSVHVNAASTPPGGPGDLEGDLCSRLWVLVLITNYLGVRFGGKWRYKGERGLMMP